MLRTDSSPSVRLRAVLLIGFLGAGAAALVVLGNPGNMGLCGACFLRDLAGALGFSTEGKGPAIFRPELAGLVLGATLLTLLRRRFVARSGSYAALRFALGIGMAILALVFLGCPFRLLQRLGGADLNAWFALPGLLLGVRVAMRFEAQGYAIGTTAPAPAPVGLAGPIGIALLLGLFFKDMLFGPGPESTGGPPHAPWAAALSVSTAAGLVLSATGFCAVSAVRGAFNGRRAMTVAALVFVLGYGLTLFLAGKPNPGFLSPIAHSDHLWNFAAVFGLGLAGAMAGGCPIRQLVMTGEGNGDAFMTVSGVVVGGALAHNFGLVSRAAGPGGPGGPTASGRIAVVAAIVLLFLAAAWVTAARRRAASTGESAQDRAKAIG